MYKKKRSVLKLLIKHWEIDMLLGCEEGSGSVSSFAVYNQ
jgi:hypothetical protein